MKTFLTYGGDSKAEYLCKSLLENKLFATELIDRYKMN